MDPRSSVALVTTAGTKPRLSTVAASRISLPAGAHALLHPDRGRDRRRRGRHCQALTVGRVDDGDGVAGAGSGRLVELGVGVVSLEGWRQEATMCRVHVRRRNLLRLLCRGACGGVACKGGPFRTAVSQVTLGDEAGAELQVILKVKRATKLVLHAETGERRRLVQLLHTSHTPELFVRVVLRDREPRAPAIPTTMVTVGDSRGCGWRGMLLVGVEVVVRSHCC